MSQEQYVAMSMRVPCLWSKCQRILGMAMTIMNRLLGRFGTSPPGCNAISCHLSVHCYITAKVQAVPMHLFCEMKIT